MAKKKTTETIFKHIIGDKISLSDKDNVIKAIGEGWNIILDGEDWRVYKPAKCICQDKPIGVYGRQIIYLSQWCIS